MTARTAGQTAFAAALALLTGRALTVGELSTRLQHRGFDPEAIAEANRRLSELGLLDDRRTAEAWIASAAHIRGLGPRRLRAGLLGRQLQRELVDEVLDGFISSTDETRLASAALGKWERTKGTAADPRSLKAAYAHLRRRGFSNAAVRAVLFNRVEIE